MVDINNLINPAASVGGNRTTGPVDTPTIAPKISKDEYEIGLNDLGPVLNSGRQKGGYDEYEIDVNDLGALQSEKHQPIDLEANSELFKETTKQNFWLHALDFVAPDSLMSIISTGATDPRAVNAAMEGSELFYSITNPALYERNQKLLAEETFFEKYLPISNLPDKGDRAAANALSSLGDLTMYTGAKGVGQAAAVAARSLLPSFFGSLASEQAVETAQRIGLGEKATTALALSAAMTTGTVTGLAQAPIALGGQVVGNAGKKFVNTLVNKEQVIDEKLTYGRQKLVRDMLESQEDLPKIIAQAQRMANRLGHPDLKIARIAPLVANPEINRRFNELYTKNSNGLKTELDSAIKEYNTVLSTYLRQFGGNPSTSERSAQKAAKTEQDIIRQRQDDEGEVLVRKLKDIDNQVEELSQKLKVDVDSVQVGNQLKNLLKAQEELARRKQSNTYETILRAAERKNLTFEDSSVERIYYAHKEERFKELFGAGNRLSNIIEKELKPEKVETGEFHPPTNEVEIKNPRPVIEEEFPELTVRQIDSFKREINLMLRDKNLNESSRRTLNVIKRTFEEELDASQPDFAQALKAADLEYLENVGVPYNIAGVAQMSRAKYAADSMKKLLNPEAAAQFLAVAGDQGPDVLKSAILINLQERAFKDSVLNESKFNNWMSKSENKRLISMVPELSAELDDIPSILNQATDQRKGLLAQQAKVYKDQTDEFFTALGKNTDQVVAEMLNNNAKLNSHIDSINALSPNARGPILATIQQRMIGNALYKTGLKDKTYFETITDPKNRTAYIKVLGPSYFKDLQALAKIKDSQAQLNLDKLQTGKTKQQAELGSESLGMGVSRITSVARERITSNFTKVMYLLSVVGSKQFNNAKEAGDVQFMLSPDTVKVLADGLEKQADGNYGIKKGAVAAVTSVLDLIVRGGYSSGKTVTQALTYGERDEQEINQR